MKLDIWLPYSKQADTRPYREQNESRKYSHTLFLQSTLILPYPQVRVLVVSLLQISRLNFCAYFSILTWAQFIYYPLISSALNLVQNTTYEPSC